MKILPIILCGGSGSRLWPISREQNPKPFLRLTDGMSLIQHAFTKAGLVGNMGEIITVANKELFFRAKSEFDELDNLQHFKNTYILEPEGRNTAPAITIATLDIQKKYGDDVCIMVLAADHLISGDTAFINAVTQAGQLALQGNIVTFGIKPTAPETGYGYIHYLGSQVRQFVEKPDKATAQGYLNTGEYLWNSGMFCFTPNVFLAELEAYRNDILTTSQVAYTNAQVFELGEVTQLFLPQNEFTQVPSESVDYAVMEHSKHIAVVPCEFSWSDVGSWTSLADIWEKDGSNNAIRGEVLLKDVKNSIMYSEKRLIAGIGLEDMVIIDTDDAILVANRHQCQAVKAIYNQLKDSHHESYKVHKTVHRPWGNYSVVFETNRYKIKQIVVNPKQRLSLQHHHHRSEHWLVIAGQAEVLNGTTTSQLSVNDTAYIPQGKLHRLLNIGDTPLVVVEIQFGDYLGEDDIVRHEDDYQRVGITS